ncbi:hypothetical protein Tsubulata_046584 [Turnera subulata]|uniref:F-box domain-containing protein n=1 Tax=Turnera subulata TaxID=218843 RepID=A0A9Q0J2Z4_9ROSI|nr:hypothetical protein Tsubulata_046584 [Turnera subulata]
MPSLLDNLDDDLLAEILCRLVDVNFTVRCKLVCRRWCSLISTHNFERRFQDQYYANTPTPTVLFGFIANYPNPNSNSEWQLKTASQHQVLKSCHFKSHHQLTSIGIVASYKEVLLCRSMMTRSDDDDDQRIYYVFNPRTWLWVALPPFPKQRLSKRVLVGFVCEGHNFRVVRILEELINSNIMTVEIFDSETNQWREHSCLVSRPISFNFKYPFTFERFPLQQRVFGWNGILHWFTKENCLVAYDPYNPEQCHLIDVPLVDDDVYHRTYHLGMCQGALRLVRLRWVPKYTVNPHTYALQFSAWKLGDYKKGDWESTNNGVVSMTVRPGTDGLLSRARVSPDPNHEDIVYLMFCRQISCCNLKTQTWNLVDVSLHVRNSPDVFQFFQLIFPPWPTTIHITPK